MNKSIIKKLINNIKKSDFNKSSYWQKHLSDNSNFFNEFEHLNFGAYQEKKISNILEDILIRIIFTPKIFKTQTYKRYKSIFDSTNRYINSDTIRHIFTFEKLNYYLKPKTICIIGDGKLNAVLGAHLTYPLAKIYSVNLSETLINDYVILNKTNIDLKKSVEVVDDINFISNNEMLTLVPSNFKEFLLNKNIELFINISSFQEMSTSEINNYFEIIKNNKSKLYCCNREYKKLYEEEELYFEKYPFANSKIIFWEDCPWLRKYYSLRFPFIHNYDGNHKHCLVDFS